MPDISTPSTHVLWWYWFSYPLTCVRIRFYYRKYWWNFQGERPECSSRCFRWWRRWHRLGRGLSYRHHWSAKFFYNTRLESSASVPFAAGFSTRHSYVGSRWIHELMFSWLCFIVWDNLFLRGQIDVEMSNNRTMA